MEGALQDVISGKSVRRAALEHDVPKSTLHDRVSGKVLPGAVGDDEEDELVRWLEGCAEVGCAKHSKSQVVGCALTSSLQGGQGGQGGGWNPCSQET